jgi:phosphoglycolate phosphatase
MTDPKLVVFDVDGTLCDSQHHIVGAMEHAFAAGGLACPPREAVLSIVGLSLPVAMARLVPDLPVVTQEALVASYKAGYARERAARLAPLYDGIHEVIVALREQGDVILAVATGKSRRGLDQLLQGHGLEGAFFTRQVADDHPSKPHPSMLFATMADAGVPPERTVMIGDTTYDIVMGRAAGVSTLAVTWGYHAERALAAERPDRIVGTVRGIPAALAEFWERT